MIPFCLLYIVIDYGQVHLVSGNLVGNMFMIAIVPIMIATTLVLLFRFMNQKCSPPIFGIYQQGNKYFWFKFVFMYIFLRAKQLYLHCKGLLAVELGYSYDGTVHIREDEQALEQKYNLGDYPKSVDAVYFNGCSKGGVALICGIARRPEHFCDAFMYLKVKDEDLLLSPVLPDTVIKQTPLEERKYKAGGISAASLIPMRTWKVSYNGDMKYKNNNEKTVNVTMDLTWSATWPAFNYDTDMSPISLARDMAREKWSADFFKLFKKFHQTHYEQMGILTGSVFIEGQKHSINMPCVREHTFGKLREWRNFHRYVLHFIFLENGDCMEIGSVSHSVVLSHITIGYLCRKIDQAVLPVRACDFQLWQHGENQVLPKDYGFSFNAGGERYDVQVRVTDEDSFYIGKERETRFYERWATFEVNGIKGWGCVEWQYNNLPGVLRQ